MDLPILVDVVIGLSLVYLVASLFVTIANEYIAHYLNLRGKQLAKDLKTLIADPAVVDKLKASPALKPFFTDGQGPARPSYVDPGVLAHMLVGAVAAGNTGVATLGQIVEAIEKMDDTSPLKGPLSALSRSVAYDVDKFVQSVAAWADQSLTMLGEVYKKRTQIISLCVGLVVAGAFNLDSIAIIGHLYRDKDAREATAMVAAELVDKTSPETFQKCVDLADDARRQDPSCAMLSSVIDGLKQRQGAMGKLPIGWARFQWSDQTFRTWALVVVGWVLTALAVSLGASFWFDLLKHLVNIRHGMRRPEPGASPAK